MLFEFFQLIKCFFAIFFLNYGLVNNMAWFTKSLVGNDHSLFNIT